MAHSDILNEDQFREFSRRIIETHGGKGRHWLDSLPELLSKYEERWNLKLLHSVDHLSYNLVIRASDLKTGNRVIFKAGVPGDALDAEAFSLITYAGKGSVNLLNCDRKNGVLLLEEIQPGNTLDSLSRLGRDEEATLVCCDIIRKLHSAAKALHTGIELPTLESRAEGWTRLEMERQRIWGWSFSQTILASWWNFEDHGSDWQEWYELGKIMLEMK